ncbi:MAG TPA: biotin/lipoyl-containing protein, partial [bacterium]
MRVNVIMPQLGESVAEGTIVKWLKKVGDPIQRDENILEISTDKVDSEIPAPASGILVEILAQEGETIPIGKPIAVIETDAAQAKAAPAAPVGEAKAEKTEAPTVAYAAEPGETKIVKRPTAGKAPEAAPKRFLSPLVKSIAQAEGITTDELDRIPGTGAGGRLTKTDLLNYLEQRKAHPKPMPTRPAVVLPPAAAAPAPAPTPGVPAIPGEGEEVIPMDI